MNIPQRKLFLSPKNENINHCPVAHGPCSYLFLWKPVSVFVLFSFSKYVSIDRLNFTESKDWWKTKVSWNVIVMKTDQNWKKKRWTKPGKRRRTKQKRKKKAQRTASRCKNRTLCVHRLYSCLWHSCIGGKIKMYIFIMGGRDSIPKIRKKEREMQQFLDKNYVSFGRLTFFAVFFSSLNQKWISIFGDNRMKWYTNSLSRRTWLSPIVTNRNSHSLSLSASVSISFFR